MAKRNVSSARAACESLENRLMLFTYQVTGTGGSDAISLTISGNSIISVVNGVSDSGSDWLNGNIEINALGGNDTISIIKNGNNTVTVNAGSGNDTINFSPGERDLDAFNVYDLITVNGEGNSDTVVLFDDNETELQTYGVNNGHLVSRSGGIRVAAFVESVTVRAGSGTNYYGIGQPPIFGLSLLGGATFDSLSLYASAGAVGSYEPSGTTARSGALSFAGSSIEFQSVDAIGASNFATFTFTSPNPNDFLTLNAGSQVVGSSGGVDFAHLVLDDCGTLIVDTASHDGTTGNDTLFLNGTQSDTSLVQINSGIGTDTLTNNGTFTIDSVGSNLSVTITGGTLTFDGAQQLKRLEVNNGSIVRFNGTGTVLTTKELAVTNGSGTIDLAANQSGNVPVGQANQTFSIGAGRTFIKKGAGTLSVFAVQNHGAGSTLKVVAGTMNIDSDAGSATTRPLALWASAGTVNLNATQHLNSVVSDVGLITMVTSGIRVLVTNSVFFGGEGGGLDLRDNDMIVDYASPAEAAAVQSLLRSGRANGSWNGIGIASSTAATNPGHITTLGSMEAVDFKGIYGASATFAGQALDDTAVLIKYTYYGDADFNGQVTEADYQRMAFGNSAAWINGDFDDNEVVNTADTALIDAAFSGQGPAL
jgi:hypothetical protein